MCCVDSEEDITRSWLCPLFRYLLILIKTTRVSVRGTVFHHVI